MLVSDRPQYVANWVAAQRGETAPTVDHAIGFEYEGDLRAGVYFDGMTGNNIFAHIASNAPIFPRSLLMAVAFYVYDTLGVDRMTFAVPADNRKVIAFVEAMGAKREAVLKLGADEHTDLHLYALWRTDAFPQRMLNPETRDGK